MRRDTGGGKVRQFVCVRNGNLIVTTEFTLPFALSILRCLSSVRERRDITRNEESEGLV